MMRFLDALGGGMPDMVPVFLRELTLALDECDLTTPEVCGGSYDPHLSAQAVLALHRRLGQDAVVGCIHHMGIDPLAFGGDVTFPERGIPSVIRAPFSDVEAIEACDLAEVMYHPVRANVARSYSLVSERVKDAEVVLNIEGPMTKAGLLRGLEALLMDLSLNPDVVARLVDISVQLAEDMMDRTSQSFAATFIASATDNPDIFGMRAFRRSSLPGVRRLVSSSAAPVIFHPHGVFTSGECMELVNECISTGIAGFQFAEGNDLQMAKRSWGVNTCVLGGVDTQTTLLLGPEARIVHEAERIIDHCAPGGGFVMMCSGSLHRGMPIGNVEAMVRACRRCGRYSNGKLVK
jgi:uroporphyrinogen-III decarboxylase